MKGLKLGKKLAFLGVFVAILCVVIFLAGGIISVPVCSSSVVTVCIEQLVLKGFWGTVLFWLTLLAGLLIIFGSIIEAIE